MGLIIEVNYDNITGELMNETNIINILKKSKSDLSIQQIADEIKVNRITASKYLAILEAKGIVTHRNIGKAKLFSVRVKG